MGPAFAQGPILLRGRVVDAETHQPVPNAQVGVAGNRIGTSTNEDGRFALSIPPQYQHERLTVALLGYRNYSQALPLLPAPELRIELRISPAALGEVQVTASVEGIVREAVARIPQNYPERPTRLTGFYRESENDAAGRPRYLAEGLLTVFKVPYRERTADGEIEIQQSRKVDLRPPAVVEIDWMGGPFLAHGSDFVHRRAQFIRLPHLQDYAYRLGRGSTYQGRPVYVVEFGPRPGNKRAYYAGRMYIEQDSYAFLGAEWHYTPAGLNHARYETQSLEVRVVYQPYAGRWHLQSVWWKTTARLPISPWLYFFGEFQTTAIDTTRAPRLTYLKRTQFTDVFVKNAVPYDSAYWRHHATLLPPDSMRPLQFDRTRQQRADSLFRQAAASGTPGAAPEDKSGLTRLLSRLSYGASVGMLPLQVPGSELLMDFAPAGSTFRAQGTTLVTPQNLTGWRSAEYDVDIARGLAVRLATTQVFHQFSGDGWEAGLSYQHNLNPRHRPIYARAGLAYTRLSVARSLGSHANPDASLRVAGTRLGADELALRLQSVTDAVQPKLGLGIELSHKIELVADLGYLLPLRTRTQLQVEESSGFFLTRSSAALDLPAAEVGLRVNQQPASTVPWQLNRLLFSFGLLYRVR
ncbi:MAG: hypothetical protein JWR44_3281 [Hymenobacter sp.]|jgi:hypothetical protein|nr:hypothetical protein [Hymenobacter sp.]